MSMTTSVGQALQLEKPADAQLTEALRATALLSGLDDRVLHRLAAVTSVIVAPEGSELSRQGDLADRLFIVLEGQLAGSSAMTNGTTAVVEVIHAGQTLGLSTVLARLPRLLTVSAITRCRVLSIDAAGLLALIAEEPTLVSALMRAEANEFNALVRQVCDLKMRTTAQRLGCYLLALTKEKQANTAALRLPFDKRLLAARLGCRQENLSRAFAALRSFGVETHGARVILHDIAKLRAYSEPDEPMGEAFA